MKTRLLIKKLALIVMLTFYLQNTWSQISITGSIKDLSGIPLPMVDIVEKGTANSTRSDMDGFFTISVKDSTSILIFSFVGFVTRETSVTEKSPMSVTLKEYLHVEGWDQKIAVYANSGLINNPIGGQLDLSIPAFNLGLKSTIAYQTNLSDNQIFMADLGIRHIRLGYKGLGLDIDLINRSIISDNGFKLDTYSVESLWYFFQYNLIIGYSYIDLKKRTEIASITGSGLTIGAKYWFKYPIDLLIGKASFYKDIAEYNLELERSFKRVKTFIRYYNVNSYSELSLGIGLEFTYYFKRQKNEY